MKRVVVVLSVLLAACEAAPKGERRPSASAAPAATAHVVIEPAPEEGSVAAAVSATLARVRMQNRKLLVYVGAHWCEPCMRFHRAAAEGKLDARFPDLTLLEFDLDRDRERLSEAGYRSQLIPLFAVPEDDGTASPVHIEGSVKGDGAVEEISPRLAALLAEIR